MDKEKDQDKLGEDITFTEANEDGEAVAAVDPVRALKKLREKLKVCQAERGEYLATSQRLKADYINFKREVEQEKGSWTKLAKSGLLLELLDLADNFELAFANKTAWEAAPANWRQGVEYIYAKLKAVLESNGLTEINPERQTFNPSEQESVGMVETNEPGEDGLVLLVTQKGYKLEGKVLRPARVKVGALIKE